MTEGAIGKIAFVQATWHRNIVDQARVGFVEQMGALGQSADCLEFFEVPGAFEIPLLAKRLATTGQYAAVVAAALVVNGGIYRHEFVASAVIDGLMRVQLDTDTPVFSVVLTPLAFHEHADHIKFFTEHFVGKGAEAANACMAVLKGARPAGD